MPPWDECIYVILNLFFKKICGKICSLFPLLLPVALQCSLSESSLSPAVATETAVRGAPVAIQGLTTLATKQAETERPQTKAHSPSGHWGFRGPNGHERLFLTVPSVLFACRLSLPHSLRTVQGASLQHTSRICLHFYLWCG